MPRAAALALVAALALAGCRAVSVRDNACVPVRLDRPQTVMWNFSTGWGRWRGSWQLSESDSRVGPDFYDGSSPEQIKVIYYGPTEVLIAWSTGNSSTYVGPVVDVDLSSVEGFSDVQIVASTASSRRSPYLQTAEDGLARTVQGDVAQYAYNYGRHIPGATNYTSGVLHRVRVGDLAPGATYSYRVGSELTDVWSDWHSFSMPGNSSTYPITFGLIGDGGQTSNSSTTYDRLLAADPDVVVWLGDLSYSDTRCASNGDRGGTGRGCRPSCGTQDALPAVDAESAGAARSQRAATWKWIAASGGKPRGAVAGGNAAFGKGGRMGTERSLCDKRPARRGRWKRQSAPPSGGRKGGGSRVSSGKEHGGIRRGRRRKRWSRLRKMAGGGMPLRAG